MMNAVMIAADVSAVLLAGSKLITTFQPLWASLPKWVAAALPVVVAVVPQVVAQLAGVTTDMDLVGVGLTAAALLVPGIAHAEAPPPPNPPATAA